MKYCDLHCDALTASGAPQVTKARLMSGGCLLQCFAAFVGEGGYARFLQLADAFDVLCAREGYHKVLCGIPRSSRLRGAVRGAGALFFA